MAERESMSMDKFNSSEDIEWAKGAFDDGAEARIFGYGRDQCPSADTIGEFAQRSWLAGWIDADTIISSEGVEPASLSPTEDEMMRMTFAATMKRAADVMDAITEEDVTDAQITLLREGMTLEQVARIDRARLGCAHLRACSMNLDPQQSSTIKKLLEEKL